MSNKPYKNKEWLYQEYVVKERPATEIADLIGCHYSTIYYWLEKHGIPKRDFSEARVVVFKDPEKRRQRAQNQAELWQDPKYRHHQMEVRQSEEWRERQSQLISEVWQDPEYYERQREASRELWQDPEYREKTLTVDFYLPEYETAVECDGAYWHQGKEEKDAKRDAYLEFSTVHFQTSS